MNLQGTKQHNSNTGKMPTIKATEARRNFSDVFHQAHYGGGVLIENHGKKVAVIPLFLLDRLAELEALIDRSDAQEALAEFQQSGGVTLDDLEKELNLE